MDYSKIIAVSGLPGLHELISSKNDGAIVRSLDDTTNKFVSSRIHNFSHLESIEIYTVRDNVNLVDILQAMQKTAAPLPDTKDNAAIKKYFETAYPDLDFERVYSSDMKKIVKWFEILQKNKVEIKLSEPAVVEDAPEEEVVAPPVKEKAAKPAKAVKEEVVAEEEAPKKKAAPKKKETAETTEKPAKAAAAKAPKAATKTTKETPVEEVPKKKAAPKKK